jgi:hypothetical protein
VRRAEAALSTTATSWMGGTTTLDRRREMTRVGRCWAETRSEEGTTTLDPRKIETGCQGYRAELKE